MIRLMRDALTVAREGMAAGEAPIGCVLARGDGSIVTRAQRDEPLEGQDRARRDRRISPRGEKASMDARDLILVSTLEPCVMCTGAAMEAAVDTIVFGLRAPADSGTGRVKPPKSPESKTPKIIGGVMAEESLKLFEEWLERNRGTPQAAYVEQLLALQGRE